MGGTLADSDNMLIDHFTTFYIISLLCALWHCHTEGGRNVHIDNLCRLFLDYVLRGSIALRPEELLLMARTCSLTVLQLFTLLLDYVLCSGVARRAGGTLPDGDNVLIAHFTNFHIFLDYMLCSSVTPRAVCRRIAHSLTI